MSSPLGRGRWQDSLRRVHASNGWRVLYYSGWMQFPTQEGDSRLSGLETILSIVMATNSSVILSSCGKRSCVRLWLACLWGGHCHMVEMKLPSHLLLCSINQASSILEGSGPLCVKLNLRVFSRFRILWISDFRESAPPVLSLEAGFGGWVLSKRLSFSGSL